MSRSVRGQIWVETVIYTLLGLTLIGIVLGIAMPKINEWRDRIVVEQSISALSVFDDKVTDVATKAPSNIRVLPQFYLKRGNLMIDGVSDSVILTIPDLGTPYSEPGKVVRNGRVSILSQPSQRGYSVALMLNYSNFVNLTYQSGDAPHTFTTSTVPYQFLISNLGDKNGIGLNVIDIIETRDS